MSLRPRQRSGAPIRVKARGIVKFSFRRTPSGARRPACYARCVRPSRDASCGNRRCGRLQAAGFAATTAGGLELRGEPAIVRFFARDLPRLEQEWKVTIGERFAHVTRDVQRVRPKLEIRSSGENWFELGVELATPDGERFAASEIQRLIQSGRNSVRLRSGKTAVFDSALLDELQQVLTDCEPEQRQPGVYRIDRRHVPYVESIVADNAMALSGPTGWKTRERCRRRAGGNSIDSARTLKRRCGPTKSTESIGLIFWRSTTWQVFLRMKWGSEKPPRHWLFFRHLGGLSLVVCPASLVENWRREAARFVPELKCLAIHRARTRRPVFLNRERQPRHHQLPIAAKGCGPLSRHPFCRDGARRSAAHQESREQNAQSAPDSVRARSTDSCSPALRWKIRLRDIWSSCTF